MECSAAAKLTISDCEVKNHRSTITGMGVQTENESNWRSLRVDHGSKTNLGESIYTPKNSVFKKVGYKPYARW